MCSQASSPSCRCHLSDRINSSALKFDADPLQRYALLQVNSMEPQDPNLLNTDFVAILDRARQGDRDAIDGLITRHYRSLLSIATELHADDLRAKAGASDFVQDSLLIVRTKISQFEGSSEGEFVAWIRQILVNEIRQFRRQYQFTEKRSVGREVSIDVEDNRILHDQLTAGSTPSSIAVSAEKDLSLMGAILLLPDDYQQVIRLRYWEKLTFDEIGSRMNRSGEAVRKICTRAMLQLERDLKEQGIDQTS